MGNLKMGSPSKWAVVFLVVALIAAFFGFGGGVAAESARILFWVALVLLVVSAVIGVVKRAEL